MKEKLFKECVIESPCKINLHLKIGETRPDGFHDLESLFMSLAFGDTLQFECTGEKGDFRLFMNWEVPGEEIPPERNLVSKAVSLYREQTGFDSGLIIRLDKRIPPGAGLGGGSSNAASSLLALNCLSGLDLPMEKLVEMASSLGSDVPFFLFGGAAFVCGCGESVEHVDFSRKLPVILMKPSFSCDTSHAYRLLDQAREGKTIEKIGKAESKEVILRALKEDPGSWPFQNDFLPVFLDSVSTEAGNTYVAIIDMLRKAGASFAGLTGSGAACFGIFKTISAARRAERELSQKFRDFSLFNNQERPLLNPVNFVKMTFFLAHRADPVLKY